MKKLLISIFVLLLASFTYVHLIALPKAKENIERQFKSIGFEAPEIESIHYKADGLHIPKIYLDKNRFNEVTNAKLEFIWPQFLFKSEINALKIQKLQIITTTQELYDEITTIKPRYLSSWPNTTIYNLAINIGTSREPIRVSGKLQSNTIEQGKNIDLTLSANEDNLSFNSHINGDLNNNDISLDANFSELKLNMYPASLSRGNGWLSIQKNDQELDVSAEMNAGSGKVFNLPLQSINITSGTQENSFPVIFRSNISGNETTSLSADIDFAQKIENQDFNIRFKSDDFQDLLTYLSAQNIINEQKTTSVDFEKLLVEMKFLKERRFADGPWPFELTTSNQDDKSASGIFLLYPDKFDLRGSAQGDKDILSFLSQFIKEDDMDGDILRVEKNIKDYIFKN